jgi:hypothetical protein
MRERLGLDRGDREGPGVHRRCVGAGHCIGLARVRERERYGARASSAHARLGHLPCPKTCRVSLWSTQQCGGNQQGSERQRLDGKKEMKREGCLMCLDAQI